MMYDGGPAFPCQESGQYGPAEGMSLRAYYAGQVIPEVYAAYIRAAEKSGFDKGWVDGIAAEALSVADAMIRALERR